MNTLRDVRLSESFKINLLSVLTREIFQPYHAGNQ